MSSMDVGLLEGEDGSVHVDLFPHGTTCFVSANRPRRLVKFFTVFVVMMFPILLIPTAFLQSTVLLIVTFAFLVIGAGSIYAMNQYFTKRYKQQVREGSWLEGIFLFPSGEVCIRFEKFWSDTNVLITPEHLAKADVAVSCSITHMARLARLRLKYMDEQGKAKVIQVPATSMVADVLDVAHAINEAKVKALSGSGVAAESSTTALGGSSMRTLL